MAERHHDNHILRPSHAHMANQSEPADYVLFSSRTTPPTNPFLTTRRSSYDLDAYFTGPRDISKHSKWPHILRMHGSILPKMLLPLVGIGLWSTFIYVFSRSVHNLAVNSVLLTILGFVVSLGLSFRSSSAYERYGEGRKYWASLTQASQALGRVFWIHTKERPGEQGRKDLLAKLTAMNLLVTFAVALKHKLRWEPYTDHDDLGTLVAHLDVFAKRATEVDPDMAKKAMRKHGFFKSVGEYLGVSFAKGNPRKAVKEARVPLGNTPLEVLSYLAAYMDEIIDNGQLPIPMQQTLAYNNLAVLNDVLTGTERVLTTPLPIAYSIAISQSTWMYVILLPFQLVDTLRDGIMIPASIVAAYIILGLLYIGREVENPFGRDVNDLPLDDYCVQVAAEMDIISSKPKPRNAEWIESLENRVMWPLSQSGYPAWLERSEGKLRESLKARAKMTFEATQRRNNTRDAKARADNWSV